LGEDPREHDRRRHRGVRGSDDSGIRSGPAGHAHRGASLACGADARYGVYHDLRREARAHG